MSDELEGIRKLNMDKYPRVGGVLFLLFGLFFGYIGFYLPIQDALQHAPNIVLHEKAIFFAVALTIFGVVLLILGPMAVRLAYRGAALRGWKLKLAIVAAVMPLLLAAILVDHIFQQFLESFGYKF